VGNSISRMPFLRATTLIDAQEISQLAVQFKKLFGESEQLNVDAFRKNFIRPSLSVCDKRIILFIYYNSPL
jgi:hypothetical protein